MGELGATTLWMAICLATYSGVGSVVGKIFGIYALLESSRKSVYLLVLVLGVCTASLVGLFISRDFSIAYVAGHSNLAMDYIYTWVAFYAGNEGSLLYIAFVLSVMAALAVRLAPSRVRPTLPFSTAIMMVVLVFFLVVMAFMANPFAKLPITPPDGEGINTIDTFRYVFSSPCSYGWSYRNNDTYSFCYWWNTR